VRKSLAIALKDVRAFYRQPAALAMALLAPIALAAVLGAAFGGSGFSLPKTQVSLADLDKGASGFRVGQVITQALGSKGVSDLFSVSAAGSDAAARKAVDGNKADAAVIVPAGASAALTSVLGGQASIELYQNPTQQIGPAVVKGVVDEVVATLNGGRAAAEATAGLLQSAGPAQITKAAAAAAQAYTQQLQAAPPVTYVERGPSGGSSKNNVAGSVLAGMMVFFMLFAAMNVARTILDEEEEGTLPRLFTTPTPLAQILGGKFLSIFATVLVQSILLLLAGLLIFGAHWGGFPQVALLALDGAAMSAGLAVLLISVVHNRNQAGNISAGVFLVLALFGGNFTGNISNSGFLGVVQRVVPNGWLMRGWVTTMNGGGLRNVVVPLLAAAGFAVLFFAIGTLRFRRRYA
jgi:ABC-2 type transport system permease protein